MPLQVLFYLADESGFDGLWRLQMLDFLDAPSAIFQGAKNVLQREEEKNALFQQQEKKLNSHMQPISFRFALQKVVEIHGNNQTMPIKERSVASFNQHLVKVA